MADTGNALVRLITAASRVEFRAPPMPGIKPRFDAETFGRQPLLWPVAPMEGPHEIAGTMGEARGTECGARGAGLAGDPGPVEHPHPYVPRAEVGDRVWQRASSLVRKAARIGPS